MLARRPALRRWSGSRGANHVAVLATAVGRVGKALLDVEFGIPFGDGVELAIGAEEPAEHLP